jgi:hypothetical protein
MIYKVSITGLVVCCLAQLSCLHLVFADDSSIAGKKAQWRSENNCGANCLFVMSRLFDIQPDYDDLVKRVVVREGGSSLKDLKEASEAIGIPAEAAKTNPQGLRRLSKPVICHEEMPSNGAGHYVLVLKTDGEIVTYMDGSTCLVREMSWNDFEKEWTGYILLPREKGYMQVWWAFALGWAVLIAIGLSIVSGHLSQVQRFILGRKEIPRLSNPRLEESIDS